MSVRHFCAAFPPTLSHLMLERAFAGLARPLESGRPGRFAFGDVCSLLAAAMWTMAGDSSSVEYFVRLCDLDGDGRVSLDDARGCAEARCLQARWELGLAPAAPAAPRPAWALAALLDLWRAAGSPPGGLAGIDIVRGGVGAQLFKPIVAAPIAGDVF